MVDYFSSRPARPVVDRTLTEVSSSSFATQTPYDVQSLITASTAPVSHRPGPVRTVTSQTLNEENRKFFDAFSNETTEDETIAFAFDIDGVLVKGKKALPGAHQAIKMLQDNNIPFIFLTNGGGHTEKAHVENVGKRLGLSLDEKQFVQSHSPFHDLVPKYHDKTILVLGGTGDQIRDVAHAYGFQKVVTSSDLMQAWEHIHPFPELTKNEHAKHGRQTEQSIEVAAILVWSSPRDWCLDLQVITDLLLSSNGKFGKKSIRNNTIHLPNNGYLQDNQPKLYFCNPDFEWATQHEQPRFAQGAFREALKGIWNYATKGKAQLEYTVIGKPTEATYVYGEKTLKAYNDTLNEKLGCSRRIKTVYMVGDNPESDIRGANAFKSRIGAEWKSILVESGVYEAGTTPTYTPSMTVKDVGEAVQQAMAAADTNLEAALLNEGLALLDLDHQNSVVPNSGVNIQVSGQKF